MAARSARLPGGHDLAPPQDYGPAARLRVLRPIPSLKWPVIWLGFSVYLVGWAFIDAFIDREEDSAAALAALPVMLVLFALACWHYHRRLKQRQQWRNDKLIWWIVNRELEVPTPIDDDAR
jgi:hypothetical protein